jgi:transcriptional regulator with XRE-family HTH domain
MTNNNTNNTVVGSKIKGIRESKNISIEEIVESSGLSKEQILSIENGQNMPSLGPLIKIARALGVRLGTFMDDNDALGPVICRAEDREKSRSISFSNDATDARMNMEYHPLAQQKAGRHMEPFIIDIAPNDNPDYKLSAHEGEEFIYVMEGNVELVYGKETYTLKEGDSIFYDSIVKHHIHGAPGKAAKILAVVYIPF